MQIYHIIAIRKEVSNIVPVIAGLIHSRKNKTMKITLLLIGKTADKYLEEGISKYEGRLKHYISFRIEIIPELKNTKSLSEKQQKEKEAELILKHLAPQDFLVLLDERGKQLSSIELSGFFQKSMLSSVPNVVFLVGGPYGVDESVSKRANTVLSLSKMTFSHQMIRLFIAEQVYRAFTILKNEPYHHE